jgi:hypothetical protein
MSDTTMKHHPDCRRERATCEYRETHHYCPHPEHACNCRELRTARPDAGTTPTLELETCGWCKGPISRNPHPDAGKPATLLTVGAMFECIPCLTRNRHGWHQRATTAEADLRRLTAEQERLEAENARLLEYYEANEMLEAECDEDVEAVHRALLRFVSARRVLASAGEKPSDG